MLPTTENPGRGCPEPFVALLVFATNYRNIEEFMGLVGVGGARRRRPVAG
jgi:hypothetical protein